jgi:putative endonuclease
MTRRSPTQASGDAAEDRALSFLVGRGLGLVARNVASRLGEIDLVMRDGETLVFVEVRSRSRADFGGAAASVGPAKQRRLRREAQRYLVAHFGDRWPACRFDVCALDGAAIDWIRDAF